MISRGRVRAAVITSSCLAVIAGSAGTVGAVADRPPRLPEQRCQPGAELDELSGLASDGDSWYAVNDGGTSLKVYVLDPQDCSVTATRTAAVDPYDVEDLSLAPNGALWLADTGDNNRHRESVAFHVLETDSSARLYRVRYPDGPHDAEALVMDGNGVPHIVTKEPFGTAGVYRPAASLTSDRTVPLERVASVGLSVTDTPGGPLSSHLDSIQVTGAAMNRNGRIVAIRTYTDAYLYPAPHGDLIAALQREPVRVPLPNEPQGEAIAWEQNGTLLSASEGEHPISAVAGAASLVGERATEAGAGSRTTTPSDSPTEDVQSGDAEDHTLTNRQSFVLAGGLAALLVFVVRRIRRR